MVWLTYTAGSGNCPELMDNVAWQEVDVIVSQRHTGILHPLPGKSHENKKKRNSGISTCVVG